MSDIDPDDREPIAEGAPRVSVESGKESPVFTQRGTAMSNSWYKQKRRKDRKEYQGTVENEDLLP